MKLPILRPRTVIALWGVVYVAAATILPIVIFFRLLNSILMCVAIGVVIAYSAGVRRIKVYENRLLMNGIMCTWIGGIYNRALELLRSIQEGTALPTTTQIADMPHWAAPVLTSIGLFIATVGGTLHLLAPGSIEGVVPTRNWLKAGAAFGAGALACLIITTI